MFWPSCPQHPNQKLSSVRQHHFSRFSSSRLPIKTLILTQVICQSNSSHLQSPKVQFMSVASSINFMNTYSRQGALDHSNSASTCLNELKCSNTMAKHGATAFDESIQSVRALQLCITTWVSDPHVRVSNFRSSRVFAKVGGISKTSQ